MNDWVQEHQYAEWLAACRLAAKGKALSDSSFEMEVNSIKAFLSMQSPAATPAINPNSLEIVAEDYVAPRFARKIKSKVYIDLFKTPFLSISVSDPDPGGSVFKLPPGSGSGSSKGALKNTLFMPKQIMIFILFLKIVPWKHSLKNKFPTKFLLLPLKKCVFLYLDPDPGSF